MNNIEFNNHMKAIRKSYEVSLPGKISHIRSLWDNCLKSKSFSEADFADLRFAIHQLVGSGATFGYPMVSEVAEKLELLLSILTESNTEPTRTQIEQIQSQLVTLSVFKFVSKTNDMGADMNKSDRDTGSVASSDVENPDLYIVEDDVEYASFIGMELSRYGFKPYLFNSSSDFEQACLKQKPDVVLMDMALNEGGYEGAAVAFRINTGENKPVPVVFLSANDSFESRLRAVRAGATHYFKKPVDLSLLALTLEELSKVKPILPYRVLIIDDDQELANLYRLNLEKSHMVVEVENDPLRALEVLKGFSPDLILIDVLMPNCNGLELATIIRQYHEYDLTPIVFLTTEWRKDIKLASINLGGDDFLSKPIAPWRLVEMLQERIRRARILRAGTDKVKQF